MADFIICIMFMGINIKKVKEFIRINIFVDRVVIRNIIVQGYLGGSVV